MFPTQRAVLKQVEEDQRAYDAALEAARVAALVADPISPFFYDSHDAFTRVYLYRGAKNLPAVCP
jgi:hypothetical protein